ncbi:A/G-specific adenine glycosylase [Pontixanthobacter aestiaquae]|uniref:Adenine DNA glycosylase n=1 Tax=Pontixanthobacter aestiaquae TaxID=1509367 RepID=A0A844ZAY8_9SPHN|nr:A/G-specific adenine glycosylase [Pontixanthobacter aestiaquae]MDN3644949.1 A/G-specific adenine glycosylase [Pontixanthobacter aestiaquae]MXO84050.1 A/G-specific adenine glycosylase [Pontixanthobacter aestiaquae]
MTASKDTISARLLEWYDVHARTLPWRAPPGESSPDPYRVWLSEVMLQQTTVAAVKPYFAKFTERWPTVDDLAAAPEQDVMVAWAGLGYYSRARNLVKCAAAVKKLGGFPETEEELLKLPGLGAYTAAAVAAIAFGQRAVVVDANVERVVSRLFAIEEPLPGSRKTIRVKTDGITPDRRAGDFAQAMMDLGSGICTTRDPKCLLCPLSSDCQALKNDNPARFPIKAPKKIKPVRQGTAYWIERDGAVWLEIRQGTGMLGGMRSLPDDGWHSGGDGDGAAPVDADWEQLGLVRHTFTHFSLEMSVLRTSIQSDLAERIGQWWPVAEIDDAGLPTLFAKAARLVLARG